MGVSEIGFPQNVVYKQRIQTSDALPVTIGASKYCEFLFDIDAGDRMTPLGIVGWGCNDKTQVFLLDFYLDNDLQTAKLILKNPYATSIAINSLYIDVLYSKQGLDMSEVDVVDNLTTDSAVAALSAKQGKVLDEKMPKRQNVTSFTVTNATHNFHVYRYGDVLYIQGWIKPTASTNRCVYVSGLPIPTYGDNTVLAYDQDSKKVISLMSKADGTIINEYNLSDITGHYLNISMCYIVNP